MRRSWKTRCGLVAGAAGCLAAACWPLAASGAPGEDADLRRLSLVECIRMALEQNVDLQIAQIGPEAARANVSRSIHAVYEPRLTIDGVSISSSTPGGVDEFNRPYTGTEVDQEDLRASLRGNLPTGGSLTLSSAANERSGTRSDSLFETASGVAAVELRQPLLKNLWVDGQRLQITVAKSQLAVSELTLRQALMQTLYQVEMAYYNLILAHEEVRTYEYALELAQRLVEENRRRMAVGRMAEWDVKRAEADLSARRSRLIAARGLLSQREYELKALLTDDVAAWEGVALAPSDALEHPVVALELNESWGRGLAMRPDLDILREQVEQEKRTLRYRRNQTLPQVDFVGRYSWSGTGQYRSEALSAVRTGESPSYSVGVALTVPLLGDGSARADYRIQRLEMEQAALRLKRSEQEALVEIGLAVQAVRTAQARVESGEQARVLAEAALAAEQKRLEVGLSATYELLEVQGELIDRSLEEKRARADYLRSLATLALHEGTFLERHGLEWGLRPR